MFKNGHRVLVFSYQDMFLDDLQTKSQKILKLFSSMIISEDSPKQEIIVFNILIFHFSLPKIIKLMLRG